jgi:hypothetical protein
MPLKAINVLTTLTPEMDCDEMAMGLPPVTSADFVYFKKIGCRENAAKMYYFCVLNRLLLCMYNCRHPRLVMKK